MARKDGSWEYSCGSLTSNGVETVMLFDQDAPCISLDGLWVHLNESRLNLTGGTTSIFLDLGTP